VARRARSRGWDAVGLADAAVYSATNTAPRSLTDVRTETRHRTLDLAATVTRALSAHIRSTTTLGTQRLRDSLEQFLTAAAIVATVPGATPACRRASPNGGNRRLLWRGAARLRWASVRKRALRYDKFRPIDRTMTHPSLSVGGSLTGPTPASSTRCGSGPRMAPQAGSCRRFSSPLHRAALSPPAAHRARAD